MELVLDANILFSALIKEGITRELMLADEIVLFTPEYIINEFLEHIGEIAKKTHVEKHALIDFLKILFKESNINIIPLDEIRSFIVDAKKISPDPDDVLYFAAAIRIRCGIWSNDKKLKNQEQIPVYSTHDLKNIF